MPRGVRKQGLFDARLRQPEDAPLGPLVEDREIIEKPSRLGVHRQGQYSAGHAGDVARAREDAYSGLDPSLIHDHVVVGEGDDLALTDRETGVARPRRTVPPLLLI